MIRSLLVRRLVPARTRSRQQAASSGRWADNDRSCSLPVSKTLADQDAGDDLVHPALPGAGLLGVGDMEVVLALPTRREVLERFGQLVVGGETISELGRQLLVGPSGQLGASSSWAIASCT